jgi:hypothetical protein
MLPLDNESVAMMIVNVQRAAAPSFIKPIPLGVEYEFLAQPRN